MTDFLFLADDDMMGSLKGWTEDQAVKRNAEQATEHLPVRGEYLDVTEGIKHGYKEEKLCDGKKKENEHIRTSAKLCATNSWDESYKRTENKMIKSTQSCDPHTAAGVASHHCPVSRSATTPTLPHLLRFTAEEIAAAPGIDAETFPEMGFTESLPDSHSSQVSLRSSPRCTKQSKTDEQEGQQAAAIVSEHVMSSSPPDRESGKHTVRTRTKAAEANESR